MSTRPTTLGGVSLTGLAAVCCALGAITVVFDPPDAYVDALRAVALIEATMIVVVSSLVARHYWHNYKIAPVHARLLPRHVMQLGVTLAGLTFVAVFVTISKVGEASYWWALPILLPSLTIGTLGMYDMIRWLPRRRKDLKQTGEGPRDR